MLMIGGKKIAGGLENNPNIWQNKGLYSNHIIIIQVKQNLKLPRILDLLIATISVSTCTESITQNPWMYTFDHVYRTNNRLKGKRHRELKGKNEKNIDFLNLKLYEMF